MICWSAERRVRDRRDALVVRACLWSLVLQAVPPVLVAWGGYGPGAVADVALMAVSPPVLLGVVAFGTTLAVALTQPGLEPRSDVLRGPVDERAAPRPLLGEVRLPDHEGPVRDDPPTSLLGPRVRWAAVATLVELAVMAAAVVLDAGARAGASAFADALDDGSAMWTYVLLIVQGGFVDLRAPVAFGVALSVLVRAARPVKPRRTRCRQLLPAARTTRWSPGRRPG